jgi:(p)ppGpp synthase/HD superfamily hydrolase
VRQNAVAVTFEQAVEIAARAHAGRVDKYGESELLHVLQVVMAVPPEARVVAALHDVLEDSELGAEDLRAAGLGEVELEAVELLTRGEDEPYAEYIDRVVTAPGEAGRLARVVKLADVRNNLARLTPEHEDHRERYEHALKRLEQATTPA